MDSSAIVLISAAATWFMTGLIWFVQIIHYPLFGLVPPEGFDAYHRQHTRRTTYVVVVPMLVELCTAVWLVFQRPAWMVAWIAWSGLACVAVAWLSTGLLQVPAHDRLARGFDSVIKRRLCVSNWIRTVAWTARAILMLRAIQLGLAVLSP